MKARQSNPILPTNASATNLSVYSFAIARVLRVSARPDVLVRCAAAVR